MTTPLDNAACPKVTPAMMRKAKIEKMKMDHHATSIQASWRGKSYRRDLKKIIPEQKQEYVNHRPESKRGDEYNEADSPDSLTSNNKNNNKEDDDDNDENFLEAKEDIDNEDNDEENDEVNIAERSEERQIQQAKSLSVLPTWPESLTDNFNDPDWPDLGSDNGSYGEYIQCIYSLKSVRQSALSDLNRSIVKISQR